MRRPRRKKFRALHPNVGIQARYSRAMRDMIRQMNADVLRVVSEAFASNEPKMTEVMALDATPPAETLQWAMESLARQWRRQFDNAAPRLARYFATAVQDRTDGTLRRILDQGGFSVRFRMTPASTDILESTVNANVALIRSIPQEYLTQVEGMVMRSVQTGRDLQQLTNDIRSQFAVTERRAQLIARDQNNKATSAIQKARQLEVGIKKGIWIHSGAGKEPRPKHVAADGQEFDLAKGMKVGDKGGWVMPGEEIQCRCVWRPVVPGF